MDSLADLLAKRMPSEPPEIRIVKQYIEQHFRETVGVLVRDRDIVVTVRSSALAGALRVHAHRIGQLLLAELPDLAQARRLVFRVGSM